MFTALMFWLLGQVVPPCDPLFCGMISFEDVPVGNYTYLSWTLDDPVMTTEVALMRTDLSEFWIDEFPGSKPDHWLEKSAGVSDRFTLAFWPPVGKLWFSVARTGLGEANPRMYCYLEGRPVGGIVSEWPADASAPLHAVMFFLPGGATFDECHINLRDSDFWIDRIYVEHEPFVVPSRLVPRTKGNR